MVSIKANDAKLAVDGVEFDLSKHIGKKVTVFKDPDGSLTIESKPVHQTAICELEVPVPVVNAEETGELDDMDTPVTREVITPLDLSKVKIHTFEGGE